MRFIVALTSLASLASLAVASPLVEANVTGAVDAGSDADVNAKVAIGSDADVNAKVALGNDANVDVKAKVSLGLDGNGKHGHNGFSCPSPMTYCPWTKACACPPGQSWSLEKKTCEGKEMSGAWPEPEIEVYASVGVELGSFCAISPYKICKYDAAHEYCQASLNSVTFCATVDIEAEIEKIGADVDIDIEADVSADLLNVCAGLSGLYLESTADAVVLFNTDKYSLATLYADVVATVDISIGRSNTVGGASCLLGLGNCNYDCVSYCTEGCHNYIDVDAEIGATLTGLSGLCVMPDVLVMVSSTRAVVSVAIEGMLCLVGRVARSVMSAYNCHCS